MNSIFADCFSTNVIETLSNRCWVNYLKIIIIITTHFFYIKTFTYLPQSTHNHYTFMVKKWLSESLKKNCESNLDLIQHHLLHPKIHHSTTTFFNVYSFRAHFNFLDPSLFLISFVSNGCWRVYVGKRLNVREMNKCISYVYVYV